MHTIQISEELGKGLAALAQKTGRSEKSYVEEALEQFLEDEEDYRMALEAIAEGGPNIPWEEAKKQLGLLGD